MFTLFAEDCYLAAMWFIQSFVTIYRPGEFAKFHRRRLAMHPNKTQGVPVKMAPYSVSSLYP